jgi:hypothetical protein
MQMHERNLKRLALRWIKAKDKVRFTDLELAILGRRGVEGGMSEEEAAFARTLLEVRISARLARIEILGV